MNVVYVGIASGENAGVRSRIYRHARAKEFTHFSIYEVWDNISETHIKELEGLFLNIYARDEHAFVLNKARSYKPLADTARKTASQWLATTTVETKSEPPRGTKKILD